MKSVSTNNACILLLPLLRDRAGIGCERLYLRARLRIPSLSARHLATGLRSKSASQPAERATVQMRKPLADRLEARGSVPKMSTLCL
eukprot:COSAG02_NODE_4985_length_4749_cov_5.434409_3_plen_87_part_00